LRFADARRRRRDVQESELLKGPAKRVRRVQDHTVGAIYDVIRRVNERVGNLASDLLAKANRRGARRATGTRHSTSHAATS
jgi:hypothetical protein